MSEQQITEPVEKVAKTTETQTTQPVRLIGDDGSFTDDFYTSLPDDLGSHSSLKQIKNINDLAKSYVNTKGLVGKKLEEFWTSDDEQIVAKRREIMGVPADADGYDIALPEMPEGMPYNEVALGEFKAKAAELGITQEQAKALVEWDAQRAMTAYEGLKEQMEKNVYEAEQALRKEWGNDYDYKLSKVQQATDYLGITDTVNQLGLGASPEFLKMVLDKMVPAISNDVLVESQQKDSVASVTDALDILEEKMEAYTGSHQSSEYQRMMTERGELLKKLSQKR